MTSSVIAQLPNDSLSSIDGFLYDQPSKRYVILHRHEMATLGIMEHAVTTVDFISGGPPTFFESSYQSNLNTSTGWFPKSMCLDGSSDYTIMGNDISASSCFFWHNNFIASPGRCDYIVQYPVVPRPLVPEKYYDNPAQPTSWLPLQFNPSASLYVQDVLCEIKCNQ